MKIKNILLLAGSLAAATFSFSASASVLIDINQPDASVYMAGFYQQGLAQSFTPTQGNVAGAGVTLQAGVGTTDTVTIALYDALPNQAGANQLAFASGIGTAGSVFDVFFSPVNVTVGQLYFLYFTSANDTLGIAGSTADPYKGGNTFANPSFDSYPTFDYAFRTYYDPAGSSSGNVPEPTSIALLGLGLIGFAASRRKSAK